MGSSLSRRRIGRSPGTERGASVRLRASVSAAFRRSRVGTRWGGVIGSARNSRRLLSLTLFLSRRIAALSRSVGRSGGARRDILVPARFNGMACLSRTHGARRGGVMIKGRRTLWDGVSFVRFSLGNAAFAGTGRFR